MGKYLDILQRGERDRSDISDISAPKEDPRTPFGRFGRFCRDPQGFCQTAFDALERRCPEYVDNERWQQAIADGHCFLAQWGEKAHTLAWTAHDLFGLHPVPECPAANYSRLARYDETGLIWLLRGRPVVALTETDAAIRGATAVLVYRKLRKPALGPVGDSLDDVGAVT